MRKKIALGIVAAAVAIPSLSAPAAAQYYGGYGQSYSPYDLNRDGRVTRAEQRRVQEMQRQQARYGGYYGNSYGYNQGYNQGGYGYNQGSYGYNSYPQSNAGPYSRYYNQQGYYSGPTWRGDDGRYYCRRSDGTTGLVVGGAAGALIGSQVAGRGDSTLGAILGGAIGAVIGREVERSNDRNRCN